MLLSSAALPNYISMNAYGADSVTVSACAEPIRSGTRSHLSLNGVWLTRKHRGLRFAYPPPQDCWEEQEVPHERAKFIKYEWRLERQSVSALKKAGDTDFENMENISAWYRKTFRLPAKAPAGRAFLRFNSLPFRNAIWFNGTKIGESVIGLIPASYDVTRLLHPGKTNEIVIGLTNKRGLIDIENETFVAPFYHGAAAISGNVTLEFVPDVFIDDVFLKTSVQKKSLAIECTIRNLSQRDQTLTPACLVLDSQSLLPCLKFSGSSVTIPRGMAKTFSLQKQWLNPVLWTPETPKLYLARVSLYSGNRIIDTREQRFGFREFSIRGRHFYLNNRRFTMYRKSVSAPLGRKYEDIYDDLDVRRRARHDIGHPYNTYRIWGYNPLIPAMGDEMGITFSQILTCFCPKWFPLDKKRIWLPNLLKHMQGFVRLLRNHPSVVIWNMTNETYWGKVPDQPKMKAICRQIVELVRKTDSTRPLDGDAEVSWDGLLDIISIHYPGVPGPLSQKYGNAGPVLPNDMYWLKEKGVNASWRARFVWDRPLSLGEYWHICGKVNNWINFTGEDIFDWIKYSSSDRRGRDGRPGNPFVNTLKMLTDYYRMKGVASLTPWYVGKGMDVMPLVAVRPMDFHPNFYGGKFLTRELAVFNDTARSYPGSHLQYILKAGRYMIAKKQLRVSTKPGERARHSIRISLPKVDRPTMARLTVRLCYYSGGARHELYHYDETVHIMPQTTLDNIADNRIVLLDTNGSTTRILRQLGLEFSRTNTLSPATLEDKRLLIIAPDTDTAQWRTALAAFAQNSGNILFLRQKQYPTVAGLHLPETDPAHITSRAWKRCYNHPVTAGLDNGQFSYWMPDNIVGEYSLIKPFAGNKNIILDATGLRGFAWTPLAEATSGKRLLIFCQLNLISKAGKEPMCDFLLKRLIQYALAYHAPATAPLRFIKGSDSGMEDILQGACIRYTPGLDGNGPVLIDADAALPAGATKRLRAFAQSGGRIWLRCPSPQRLAAFRELLPAMPAMTPINDKIKWVWLLFMKPISTVFDRTIVVAPAEYGIPNTHPYVC